MNQQTNGKKIYFVSVFLSETIHAIGLGFTDYVHQYAYASSPEEAELVTEEWLKSQGHKVRNAKCGTLASAKQDINSYTFPHQIINLPQAMLDPIYERRGYPAHWRDPARKVELAQLH